MYKKKIIIADVQSFIIIMDPEKLYIKELRQEIYAKIGGRGYFDQTALTTSFALLS